MHDRTPEAKELAFYYPNAIWSDGSWIKNLILFFDGIALLVPNYMKDRPGKVDPSIVAGLREHGLLEIIEPEKALDSLGAEKLAEILERLIASGALDDLAKEETAFHALSRSRLGYDSDERLAQMIFEKLKERGLAKDSEDGVSIPMHPKVRRLVLVLLSQILRPYGARIHAELNPVTDMAERVRELSKLLATDISPTSGQVIEFDLNAVLDFRMQNLDAHRRYSLSVRKFAMELSRMPEDERSVAFDYRQAELNDLANDLRKRAQKAWKKPSSFALSLAGAALSLFSSSHIATILEVAAAFAGYEKSGGVDLGPYSYLFSASERFA
jgi:hypothetical protein